MHGVGSSRFAGLLRTVETALVLALVPAVATAHAQAKVRLISRSELPAVVRDSLAVKGAVHLNGAQVEKLPGGPAAAAPATLRLTPNEMYAVRTASHAAYVAPKSATGPTRAPASVPERAHYVLPTTFITTDTGATATLALLAVIYPSSSLRYQDGGFRGSFLIGLTDSVNPSTTLKLTQPIRFQFAGEDEDVTPGGIGVDHTNLPFDSIEVTATNPGDSVRIHVIPQLDPAGADIWLHVSPELAFVDPPTKIEGLGLESATIVVREIGSRRPTQVTLTPASLVDSPTVTIGAGGTAIAHLRSRGIGPVSLTAESAGFDSPPPAVVEFVFPWMFVIAALAGGVCGGGIKWLQASAPDRNLPRAAALGAGLGAATALAYYVVRVNLLPFALDVQYLNEAAVFTLALLGGLFGVRKATA